METTQDEMTRFVAKMAEREPPKPPTGPVIENLIFELIVARGRAVPRFGRVAADALMAEIALAVERAVNE